MITLYSLASSPARADHPTVAFGSEASGPINTIAATPMPIGRLALGLRNELIERDSLSDAALAGSAEAGTEGVHSVDSINSTSLALAYGLTESISLSVRLRWIDRHDIREGELEDGQAEAHGHGDSSGLGDLVALGSWRAFHSEGFDAALQLGFKAPTGETRERDGDARLETEFQPGSGSWDAIVGGAVSRVLGRWSLHANVLFNLTTTGAQDTRIGDALFYGVAAIYTLAGEHDHGAGADSHRHLRWDAVIEINGDTRMRNEVRGVIERNSGGTTVYISPGLRVSYGKFGAFINVGYPVVDDPRGIQTDVDLRMVGGLSYLF